MSSSSAGPTTHGRTGPASRAGCCSSSSMAASSRGFRGEGGLMKFATYDDGSIDGRLVVVSADRARAVDASAIAPSLLDALQRWREVEAPLKRLSERPRRQPGAERRRVRAEALPCAVAARAAMVRRLGLSQSWPTDGPRFQQAADSGLRYDPGHVSGRERRLSGTMRGRPVRQRGGRDRLRGRVRRHRRRGSDGDVRASSGGLHPSHRSDQ